MINPSISIHSEAEEMPSTITPASTTEEVQAQVVSIPATISSIEVPITTQAPITTQL